MIEILKNLFKPSKKNDSVRQPETSVDVKSDSIGVYRTKLNGKDEVISWKNLDAVRRPEASIVVKCDSIGVYCTKPNSKDEVVTWEKLEAVVIETTDDGPMFSDVFWLLLSKDRLSSCVIPLGATGESDFFDEMQRRLPGFDNEMVIAAMSSVDNQRFLVWERKN